MTLKQEGWLKPPWLVGEAHRHCDPKDRFQLVLAALEVSNLTFVSCMLSGSYRRGDDAPRRRIGQFAPSIGGARNGIDEAFAKREGRYAGGSSQAKARH